jgi:hypothetical protein
MSASPSKSEHKADVTPLRICASLAIRRIEITFAIVRPERTPQRPGQLACRDPRMWRRGLAGSTRGSLPPGVPMVAIDRQGRTADVRG